MRRIVTLGALALLAAGLWHTLSPWRGRPAAPNATEAGTAWRVGKVPAAQVSLVYELEESRWLAFDLPSGAAVLRLMTTADLPLASRRALPTPLPDDVKWPYAVQMQLLDRQGRPLADRELHQITRLSEYRDPRSDEVITPAFYLGEDLVPADTRTSVIRLDEVEGAARLRLRLKSRGRPLSRVSARVYHPGETATYKQRYLWQRLPSGRAQNLARGNVFGTDLLTAREKQNLVRQRLIPLAPVGVRGSDYHQRSLYVLREIEGEAVRDEPPPAGLPVGPGRRAIVPLPEAGGPLRLEFRAVKPPAGGAPAGEIRLHWQGKKITRRESFKLPWDGRAATFAKGFEGGIIEVESEDTLAVRAFLPGVKASGDLLRAEPDEITPEPIFTWTYLTRAGSPVEFNVQPADAPTPMRIDVRRVWPADGTAEGPPAEVVYEMLDGRGLPVCRGVLRSSGPPSLYDRMRQHRQERLVNDPATYYFAVPAGVRRLRLLGNEPEAAVMVFNRPAGLIKVCNVPTDYHRFNRTEVAQRSWFQLPAADHQALEVQARVPLLVLQPRPSEDDPDLAAGVYEWQDHLPGGAWRGRHLLVPRDPRAPFRAEALAVTYRELHPGRDETVTFEAQPGRLEVAPSLLLLRDEETPVAVQVSLDGVPYHQLTLRACRGEVPLPPVALAGRRASAVVRVTASRPVRAYLNQHAPGDGPALVKRLGLRLDEGGLTFEYEKVSPGDELLSLFLFQPHGAGEGSVVTACIDTDLWPAPGPHASWTLRQRRYRVSPRGGSAVPVLATRKEVTDEGQTCFFPVGGDLPPGRYRLRVGLESGPGGYVILARSTPGEYEKRAIFLEHPAGGER